MPKAFLDQIMLQIKHFREEEGFTQSEMAEKLKIGMRSYQRYESGESVPSLNFIYEASQVLNFTVKELFSPLEAIERVGEVTFFPGQKREEFIAETGTYASNLFAVQESLLLKEALLNNNPELLRKEVLFQDPAIMMSVSTPKITLLNQRATKELGTPSDMMPTSSFHSSPRNVGILWAALLQTRPDYFIIKNRIDLPTGPKFVKAHAIFVSLNGHYLILRYLKSVSPPSAE